MLEKATITKLQPPAEEKSLGMFNPEEYTLGKEINYAKVGVPGLNSPVLQFVHGSLETLEMELFLDTYEAGTDVRLRTQQITDLLRVDPLTHAPPVLLFTWPPTMSRKYASTPKRSIVSAMRPSSQLRHTSAPRFMYVSQPSWCRSLFQSTQFRSYWSPSILCVAPSAMLGQSGCRRFAELAPNIGIIRKPSCCPSAISRRKPASPPMRAGTA